MTSSAEVSVDDAPATRGRLPDFFIVGHPKCGTTALYEMLRRHPQIFMPELKEPWFFTPELRTREHLAGPTRRPKTLEQYVSLFGDARPDQRVGEASPSYLRSRFAAQRIGELQPDARIVAVFREPASFLRSFHLQCVESHTESETDLRRALALEPRRRAGALIPPASTQPEALLYSDHVHYVEQLSRYHAVFPREQVLVLIYDDFRRENQVTVRTVLRFLGVDDAHPVEPVEANPSVRLRSGGLESLIRAVQHGRTPAARRVRGAVKALTPTRLRRDAAHAARRRVVYAEPRPPDQELMWELRRRFKPEVVALGEYLGRDLVTLWGYDGID
jgi:sulfotransferase family protein